MSELLVSALSSPLFGITLTLVVYLFFCTLSRKIRSPVESPAALRGSHHPVSPGDEDPL